MMNTFLSPHLNIDMEHVEQGLKSFVIKIKRPCSVVIVFSSMSSIGCQNTLKEYTASVCRQHYSIVLKFAFKSI